jgi:hypothetical protein
MSQSPLFDIYDDDIDPFGIAPLRKRRTLADLMPEEEKTSLLRELANQGSSGLSAIGWLLDTPGAVVRGGLSGGLGKAVSALWDTSEDRVTGRELLRQYGLAGEDDNWANFSGGLGAEILLDPLTYASLGLTAVLGTGARTAAAKAATRAGLMGTAGDDLVLRAARAAETGAVPNTGVATFLRGSTPRTLADDMAEEAAGQAGRALDDTALRVSAEDTARREALDAARRAFNQAGGTDELWESPLTRSNALRFPGLVDDAFDMYGSTVGDYLARGSDWLGTNLRATPVIGPVLRTAQAMFDGRVKQFTDEPGQMFGRKVTRAEQLAERAANSRIAAADVAFQRDLEAIQPGLGRSAEVADAFGNLMENQLDQIPDELLQMFDNVPGARRVRQLADDFTRESIANAERLGIPLERLTPPNDIDYFFRQRVEPARPRYARGFEGTKPIPLKDTAVASLGGASTAGRRDYTLAFPRWVLNKMYQDPDLAKQLRNVTANDQAERVLKDWLSTNASDFAPIARGEDAYDYMLSRKGVRYEGDKLLAAEMRRQEAYIDLADSIRRAPLQYSTEQLPRYGNSLNDLYTAIRNTSRREAVADTLLDELAGNAINRHIDMVPGGNAYSPADALGTLGFVSRADENAIPSGVQALASRMGVDPEELLTNYSFPRDLVDRMNTRLVTARAPAEATGLLKVIDDYTQRFKSLALLWPARYNRDMYSGGFAGLTQGAFNPLDAYAAVQAKGGNYAPLARRLSSAPGYGADELFPTGMRPSAEQLAEARVRKFLSDSGAEGLTSGGVSDDLGRQASNLTYRETFPGGAGPIFQGMGGRIRRSPVPWNLGSLRTSEGNANWLLELGDRAAEGSDAFNRIGTYLTRVRKGDAPAAAKAVADLTQINYRPEAFTAFERDILKRLVPFYSYTKGITPLVAQELLTNPSGLMGQSIRTINRLTEPSENRFTPEYLRQSAAIPIDPSFPLLGVDTPGISRVLTNIDLPHEGLLNLFTPGTGNTLTGRLIDTLTKTGQNILGQTNPLLKAPLELATNRQFYSGRQLSDLYSLAEQYDLPGGRLLDQIVFNAPGGSRVVGAARQLMDQRIGPQERAAKFLFNALTGMKVQDVDQERTARLAARTTLNQLLDQAKGMSTYENLFIKPEELAKLSPQEKRQYLLYRILQSEAAKKARERKKAAEDPMAILGVTNA